MIPLLFFSACHLCYFFVNGSGRIGRADLFPFLLLLLLLLLFCFFFFRCRLLQGLGNVDHLLRAADSLPLETLQSFQDAIDSETTLDLLNKVWLDNA